MRGNIGAEIDVIKPALPAQTHAPIAIHFAFGVSRTSFLVAWPFRMISTYAVLIVIQVISVAAYAKPLTGYLTIPRSFLFSNGHSCSQLRERANLSRGVNTRV